MIDIKLLLQPAHPRRMALALLHPAPFSSVALSPKSLASHLDAAAFERAKAQAIKVPKFGQRLDTLPFLRHAGLLGEERSAAAVLDVRAPCEYEKGHVPGAVNFPLFDDAERAEVGTLYKQEGHDVAVARGLELVDRKLPSLLDALPPAVSEGDEVLVYCKRGGMRSGGIASLLSQAPLDVQLLDGGYAAFRQWALEDVWAAHANPLVVLGGRTGSGKTDVLHALREIGAQIIDLEGDAHHRGSAFGSIGLPPQPTQQMYENVLALQWAALSDGAPTFIEDEGAHVGSCGVPAGLWAHMRHPKTPVLRMEIPRAARIDRLVAEYGPHGVGALSGAVRALTKRLGAERTDEFLAHLAATPPNLAEVADGLLTHYYDALYDGKASKRAEVSEVVVDMKCETGDAREIAPMVVAKASEMLR